jgi:hypothetical protein
MHAPTAAGNRWSFRSLRHIGPGTGPTAIGQGDGYQGPTIEIAAVPEAGEHLDPIEQRQQRRNVGGANEFPDDFAAAGQHQTGIVAEIDQGAADARRHQLNMLLLDIGESLLAAQQGAVDEDSVDDGRRTARRNMLEIVERLAVLAPAATTDIEIVR